MANSINWGQIYCISWWGDLSNQSTIDISSEPSCMDE